VNYYLLVQQFREPVNMVVPTSRRIFSAVIVLLMAHFIYSEFDDLQSSELAAGTGEFSNAEYSICTYVY